MSLCAPLRRCITGLLLTLPLGGLGGCESPAGGFEAFYGAVVDGRSDDALSRLTPRARAALEAGAAQANVALPDALRAATVRTTLKRIDVVEHEKDHALIEVVDALGQKERTAMIKVDGRWLIDAPPQPTTTPPAAGAP